MNLDDVKQKALVFLNSKLGVVLGLYLSLRLSVVGFGSLFSGGAGNVILGGLLIAAGCLAFEHFYEKISV